MCLSWITQVTSVFRMVLRDYCRAGLQQFAHGILGEVFGEAVHIGGCFVQDQNARSVRMTRAVGYPPPITGKKVSRISRTQNIPMAPKSSRVALLMRMIPFGSSRKRRFSNCKAFSISAARLL